MVSSGWNYKCSCYCNLTNFFRYAFKQLHNIPLVYTITNVLCFYIVLYFVDILVGFSQDSYTVVEDNGPAQPVLFLSEAVDCCSTISVWVHVQEIDATRKYLFCLH